MKPFLSLFLAPALALCGTYSGTVVSLDGTPVVGAVIKAGTDSVTTPAGGSFALARAAGIASRPGKTIASTSLSASPVTSHLAVENGHPRLSFAGGDIRGRARASVSPADARQAAGRMQAPRPAAARSQEDTLTVYWKGKRITVLPVPADTGNVTFRIDTAWKDDAGIPWNPRIAYGSLLDSRDGQTYRTVTIGAQTWMAENLAYLPKGSTGAILHSLSPDSTLKYGILYDWPTAMAGASSSPRGARGICLDGWHVPSDSDFVRFKGLVADRALMDDPSGDTPGIGVLTELLKSKAGWIPWYGLALGDTDITNGDDRTGFRALPAGGAFPPSSVDTFYLGRFAIFWASTTTDSVGITPDIKVPAPDNIALVSSFHTFSSLATRPDYLYSLRCLKD